MENQRAQVKYHLGGVSGSLAELGHVSGVGARTGTYRADQVQASGQCAGVGAGACDAVMDEARLKAMVAGSRAGSSGPRVGYMVLTRDGGVHEVS